MRGQAVRQRLAALQHAQNILDDKRKLARSVSSLVMVSARSSGTAGVEQRGEFLGEEQNVPALAARRTTAA